MSSFKCRICDTVYKDFYDARSHVYTSHKDEPDHCGIPAVSPDFFVDEV